MSTLTAGTVSGIGPLDMTSWDFTGLQTGVVRTHIASKFLVVSADGKTTYTVTGTGLTYDGSGHLNGGTVTGYKIQTIVGGATADVLTLSGMHLSGAAFGQIIANNDAGGAFETSVFAQNDIIHGSSGDDVLQSFGGDDHFDGLSGDDQFLLQGSGIVSADGGAGNDSFYFGNSLTGADIVYGGSDYDTVFLDGAAYSSLKLADSSFNGIENITVADGNSYYLLLQGDEIASGETLTVDASALGTLRTLRVANFGSYNLEVFGGAGIDSITASVGNDAFWLGAGGDDKVDAGAGDDTFYFGSAFTSADRVQGGIGNDRVVLDGDYASGISLGKKTVLGVETMTLTDGHSYKLTFNDATVRIGQVFTVDGSSLNGSNKLTFDGSAEANASFVILSGAGADVLKGGAGFDYFGLNGGKDVVTGGFGDDTVEVLSGFNANMKIDGGAGYDTVMLDSDLSGGVTFLSTTIQNVEDLILPYAFDARIVLNDGNVAAGQELRIDVLGMNSMNSYVDGSAETNASLTFQGGTGDETFIGGAGNDAFVEAWGGDDVFRGGGGADVFLASDYITGFVSGFSTDQIYDGGAGNDTLYLAGDFGSIAFKDTTLAGIEGIRVGGLQTGAVQADYTLIFADGNVAAGQTLTVDASPDGTDGVTSAHTVSLDGVNETNGRLVLIGGDGDDTLRGGTGPGDTLIGGVGNDRYVYDLVGQSAGANHDSIGFDPAHDHIDLWFTVTGINAANVNATLNIATLDADLAAILPGTNQLSPHRAVVIEAVAGTYTGSTFIVVDANGTAGYQAGEDLVLQILGNGFNPSSVDITDFV